MMSQKHAFAKVFAAVTLAAVSCVATPSAEAKEVVGVVTSVSGVWLAGGGQLKSGQKLSGGDVVKAREPNAKYSRVVIMLLDHTEVSRICDRRGLCGPPIRLPERVELRAGVRRPAAPRPPGFWERVVDAIVMSREPGYVNTLPRGGGKLPDEIVRLSNGRLDLGPVLRYIEGREFLLDIEAAGGDSGTVAGPASRPLRLRRGREGSAVVSAPRLTSGLYKVTFSAPGGARHPALPASAWVLVAEAPQYRRLASEYRMARAVAATWQGGKDPEADSFLRAFLGASAGERPQ